MPDKITPSTPVAAPQARPALEAQVTRLKEAALITSSVNSSPAATTNDPGCSKPWPWSSAAWSKNYW